MRNTLAAIAALLALLFAPVLWGLPPPGAQAPAELAWSHGLEQDDVSAPTGQIKQAESSPGPDDATFN